MDDREAVICKSISVMRIAFFTTALAASFGLTGCGQKPLAADGERLSDPNRVRDADISVLFVGNSHTSFHDLPNLVCRMIQFRHPGKKVYGHVIPVGFLEDVARDSRFREEVETRPWKFVVLQAQKISQSGKFEYSRQEGIDAARLAKARGARVYFFSEWGLRGVPGDGERQEMVYREMAQAADVEVASIRRAWDRALAERPEMPLHDGDGNHQSAVGAFLTACVLFGHFTGESPVTLSSFDYPVVSEPDRRYLAEMAAKALAETASAQP